MGLFLYVSKIYIHRTYYTHTQNHIEREGEKKGKKERRERRRKRKRMERGNLEGSTMARRNHLEA